MSRRTLRPRTPGPSPPSTGERGENSLCAKWWCVGFITFGGPMALIDVKISHLEMLTRPNLSVTAPRSGLTVLHAQHPTVSYYRYLYAAVGQKYYWQSRAKLSDKKLGAILNDSRVEVHVLHVDGTPAGFAELDRRVADEIELKQFGLVGEFIGQGLGKYFLAWTIEKAWSYHPRRFWLHTCTLDHPVALPNYLKAGFVLFKEEMEREEINA